MNRNFKVVFSKARGALMVVNEATSSVQAKGTKTVIAAAVAALTLGASAAMAATDSPTIKNGSLTVTGASSESAYTYTHSGSGVTVGEGESAKEWVNTGATGANTLGSDSAVKLDNGTLTVTYLAPVTTTSTPGAGIALTLQSITGAGTVDLVGANGTSTAEALNATLTTGATFVDGKDLTFNLAADGTAVAGKQALVTLKFTDTEQAPVHLGLVADSSTVKEGSTAYVNVAENTVARLDSVSNNIYVDNAAFNNKGMLQFASDTHIKTAVDTTGQGKYVFLAGAKIEAGGEYTAGNVLLKAVESEPLDDASSDDYKTVFGTNYDTLFTENVTVAGTDAKKKGVLNVTTITDEGTKQGEEGSRTAGDFSVNAYGVLNVAETATFKSTNLKIAENGEANFGSLTIVGGEEHTSAGDLTVDTLTVGDKELATATASKLDVTGGNLAATKVTVAGQNTKAATLGVSGAASVDLGDAVVDQYGTLTLGENTKLAANSITAAAQDGTKAS